MNNDRKMQAATEEQSFFQEQLPKEIIEELTPEVRRQYFLWDEITKREIQLHPQIVLPLIEEVFHKKYAPDVETELLSTEYAVRRMNRKGDKLLQSVFSDLLIRVGEDCYHLECQMQEQQDMVLRMLEYDVHIAFAHGRRETAEGFALTLPRSVVLYLDHNGKTPDYEQCMLFFQDGSFHQYRVPVMKVQEYTLEMIEEKHLNMLIPFMPIRYRDAVKSSSSGTRESAKKNLAEMLSECVMILDRERENGTLTESMRNDIAEFLSCACEHLFGGDAELIKEVRGMMEPAVKLRREIVAELQEELQNKNRKLENGLEKLIRRLEDEGRNRQETLEALQEIFSLGREEAEEKIKQYWIE